MEKPTGADYRALPALAVAPLVPMVQAVVSTPMLWKSALFVGAFIALSALTVFGAWSFFRHWRYRAIGPALIAVGYALVSFSQPSVYVLISLMLAFVVSAYFISPDRIREVEVQRPPPSVVPAIPVTTDSETPLRELLPLIRALIAALSLGGELGLFRDGMPEIHPSGDTRADIAKISESSADNNRVFSDQFRPRLVQLATYLKTKYGILSGQLSDEALARPVFGPKGMDSLMEGLANLSKQLRERIVDDAVKLEAASMRAKSSQNGTD